MNHFLVLFLHRLWSFFFFYLFFLLRSINQIEIVVFSRDQLSVPANKKVISIKVRSTNLCGHWDVSFLWEDNTIDKLSKDVGISSILKPLTSLHFRNASHFSNICRMKARVSGDYDITFNMLSFGLEIQVIENCAVKFPFIKDIVLIDDLNKKRNTPMILADFYIMMLLFTFS